MSALEAVIRTEREALLEHLETLTPEQWATPSLCTGWRVQDVAAHLAWAPGLRGKEAVQELVRGRFRPNRVVAQSAVRWSARGTGAILEQLRRVTAAGAGPMAVPQAAVLVDAVVHALDIRRPLGDVRALPPAAFRGAADFCAHARFPSSLLLGGPVRRRLAGLRLVADDQDWAHGEGAEVRASGETVLLVLAGRPVGADELRGPGAATLAGRL
ncbi:maleylpyruvate isomerase family mycothiol-dependent enzyme [Friedmanniella luteola]|nr:maleylpyruvate isomerase family mycothiol-dependent enzyme [Friedmanniella luteola]